MKKKGFKIKEREVNRIYWNCDKIAARLEASMPADFIYHQINYLMVDDSARDVTIVGNRQIRFCRGLIAERRPPAKEAALFISGQAPDALRRRALIARNHRPPQGAERNGRPCARKPSPIRSSFPPPDQRRPRPPRHRRQGVAGADAIFHRGRPGRPLPIPGPSGSPRTPPCPSARCCARSTAASAAATSTYPGEPGRGYPNQYWMIIKGAEKTGIAAPVFEAQKTGNRHARKPATVANKTRVAAPETPFREP